ncbi:MAG: hypothetical protein U1F33_12035 [Alphaproteobacteria bacterium]
MNRMRDLLTRAREGITLDDETMALFSKPETLEALDALDETIHAFTLSLGRQFLERLRERLQAYARAHADQWSYLEVVRIETVVGLKPAGQLMRFAEDYWPSLTFATSPGLPFAQPWLGIATTPRAPDRIKAEIFERTAAHFVNPKQTSPAAWWIQWDWLPDWPDVRRPRHLAYLIGEQQAALAARAADWVAGAAPHVADVLRREAGEGW